MPDFTVTQLAVALTLAARWTLYLSLAAFVFGGVLGALLAAATLSSSVVFRVCSIAVVRFVQGTPLLMQLFLIYYVPALFGKDISAWAAAVIGLSIWTGAYLSEIWKTALLSVPSGQSEAAASLGFFKRQIMLHVTIPQAVRIAIPPTAGFMVQVIKNTSLTSIVGFTELMKTGTVLANVTLDPFLVYGLVALLYFAICFPLTVVSRRLEAHLDVSR